MAGTLVSRRHFFLGLLGIALALAYVGQASRASTLKEIRIGAVLPTKTGLAPIGGVVSYQVVGDAAYRGVIMGEEEYAANAELLGFKLKVLVSTAPDAAAARRAAERLITQQGVSAFIGGFGTEQALALGAVAAQHKVPFFNIGAPSDTLRGSACNRYMFHVESSDAMYLNALAAWFVRAGYRRYFFVVGDSPEQHAHHQRMVQSLKERHFGGKEVGQSVVAPQNALYTSAFDQIRKAKPDVIVLMLEPVAQLDFLGEFEGSGINDIPVTGYPDPIAQTRTFYVASRNASARAGSGHRAALWEATMDSYGARELNARFRERWNQPMDPSAWAGYEAVKMLFETASRAGTLDGDKLVEYLERPQTSFDVHKGIGVSFRPWDHQLRQPLYLIKINSDAKNAMDLAILVGELPEIYKPGTDPVERLDQIGVLRRQSSCVMK